VSTGSAGGPERSWAAWGGGWSRSAVAVFRRVTAAAKPRGYPPSLVVRLAVGCSGGSSPLLVFYRLRELHPGNLMYVRQADSRLAIFRVTGVHQYSKAHFPTAAVYGPVPDAELHLITCGGTFDYATHSYLSNIVVYSTEVP
jgi:Sortase domain